MTDNDLRTLLREHVTSTEPPFTLRPDDAVRGGRARRTRLRLGLAGAGLAAAAAVGVVIATLPGDPAPRGAGEVAPLTQQALENYDPEKMPALLDEHVRAAVEPYLPLGKGDVAAYDDQLKELQPRGWPAAHAMDARYNWKSGHRVRVWLGHSRSEAEGNRERLCKEHTTGPQAFLFVCEATTLDDGTVVTTEVAALYPDTTSPQGMWIGLTRENLRTNLLPEWANGLAGKKGPLELDRSKLFFSRSVEAVHSETFLTNAQEIVQARSYDEALAKFAVPEAVLTGIVTDPELVIPDPDDVRVNGVKVGRVQPVP